MKNFTLISGIVFFAILMSYVIPSFFIDSSKSNREYWNKIEEKRQAEADSLFKPIGFTGVIKSYEKRFCVNKIVCVIIYFYRNSSLITDTGPIDNDYCRLVDSLENMVVVSGTGRELIDSSFLLKGDSIIKYKGETTFIVKKKYGAYRSVKISSTPFPWAN